MKRDTPFINPNDNIDHQLLISMIILTRLDKTIRHTNILTFQRFVLYDFLINNPNILNILLQELGKKKSFVFDYEKTRLSIQKTNKLFKNNKLKITLQLLLAHELADSVYSTKHGILYTSTNRSKESIAKIETSYSNRLKCRADSMMALQSSKIFKLTTHITEIMSRL